ncbi:ThiF family adenylyltransferase [Streptomyces albidoflavus]|uniref:ThiF family adenylyltransferase n=1 Tax=Streptomyces albidoflavus TaxID=1886 RepID=UPI000FF6F040|nr:ThiF family adenylyltransferase [Streptomyces albidoflavus]RWZ72895.1 ThiF family adenylyltransferase [Streptomyces albidoflavus]
MHLSHPLLKPALRRGWRDLRTVQFGATPAHAVVLGPIDTATGSFMELLDGTRGLPLLREEAHRMGFAEGYADLLVGRLARAGLLDDSTGGGPGAAALRERPAVVERLRPDLGSLTVTTREPGGAMARMAARRASRVQVRGAGRVGATLAAVLSGAGVGQVDVVDGGTVDAADVAPGGMPVRAVGERRDEAARKVVRQASPGALRRSRKGPRAGSGEPGLSLVVLTPRDGLGVFAPDPAAVEQFAASGIPHLFAGVLEATGVVGPLVIPGATACAQCVSLERVDRDPAWPRLITQWRANRRRSAPACDLALATTVAGFAATQALAFLDGTLPSGGETRWELALPQSAWRAVPLAPHPECPCDAVNSPDRAPGPGEPAARAGEVPPRSAPAGPPGATMAESR